MLDNETIQDTGLQVETSTKANGWLVFVHFMKKHWIVLSIISFVICVAVVLFYMIPSITINEMRFVNLNSEVTLSSGQTIYTKNRQIAVTIEGFTTDSCAEKGKCFGTGVRAVEYQLVVDGKKYATGTAVPAAGSQYQIETLDTDYKTYSTIRIIDTKK